MVENVTGRGNRDKAKRMEKEGNKGKKRKGLEMEREKREEGMKEKK